MFLSDDVGFNHYEGEGQAHEDGSRCSAGFTAIIGESMGKLNRTVTSK